MAKSKDEWDLMITECLALRMSDHEMAYYIGESVAQVRRHRKRVERALAAGQLPSMDVMIQYAAASYIGLAKRLHRWLLEVEAGDRDLDALRCSHEYRDTLKALDDLMRTTGRYQPADRRIIESTCGSCPLVAAVSRCPTCSQVAGALAGEVVEDE